jgi:hypothetical protein
MFSTDELSVSRFPLRRSTTGRVGGRGGGEKKKKRKQRPFFLNQIFYMRRNIHARRWIATHPSTPHDSSLDKRSATKPSLRRSHPHPLLATQYAFVCSCILMIHPAREVAESTAASAAS